MKSRISGVESELKRVGRSGKAAGTASRRTLGSGAAQAAAGSHHAQHEPGGADIVAMQDRGRIPIIAAIAPNVMQQGSYQVLADSGCILGTIGFNNSSAQN